MESTKLFSSPQLTPRKPFSRKACRRRGLTIAMAFNKPDHNDQGSLVDDNMIVLRVRMREMKMMEEFDYPPSHWMEWEKQYYAHHNYNTDVCEAVGLLQNFLMNIRPSIALGILALLFMCVLISTGVVFSYAVEITMRLILSVFHLR
ncbi:hypothetical protein MANES_02G073500v8 [Manihot esculenta]|uniref:Uncharacterized protein n=2 Tax=Manihot esculenta TaxID=3983 RepID=A0A2C9WBP8_MANES|nr:hypothetical protein MANES_02G073500v8 [Manihot esculenta]